jgi:type II secretory pathway pseudopilin PulG
MKSSGFSIPGLIASAGIIGLIVLAVLGYSEMTISRAREVLTEGQMRNLRVSVQVYKLLNGVFPQDLRCLETETLSPGILANVDEDNYPVDPFGKRYIYDPASGEICSQ